MQNLGSQTLKTLAENILSHPGEEKYKKFKPTNTKIKKTLVDPKGTLEYAVAVSLHRNNPEFRLRTLCFRWDSDQRFVTCPCIDLPH